MKIAIVTAALWFAMGCATADTADVRVATATYVSERDGKDGACPASFVQRIATFRLHAGGGSAEGTDVDVAMCAHYEDSDYGHRQGDAWVPIDEWLLALRPAGGHYERVAAYPIERDASGRGTICPRRRPALLRKLHAIDYADAHDHPLAHETDRYFFGKDPCFTVRGDKAIRTRGVYVDEVAPADFAGGD